MLEYCSSVWMSAAASYLRLLDCVVSKVVRLSDGLVGCNLEQRRRVTALHMFHKIYRNPNHTLEAAFALVHVPSRLTHLAVKFIPDISLFLCVA